MDDLPNFILPIISPHVVSLCGVRMPIRPSPPIITKLPQHTHTHSDTHTHTHHQIPKVSIISFVLLLLFSSHATVTWLIVHSIRSVLVARPVAVQYIGVTGSISLHVKINNANKKRLWYAELIYTVIYMNYFIRLFTLKAFHEDDTNWFTRKSH